MKMPPMPKSFSPSRYIIAIRKYVQRNSQLRSNIKNRNLVYNGIVSMVIKNFITLSYDIKHNAYAHMNLCKSFMNGKHLSCSSFFKEFLREYEIVVF